MIGKKFTNGKKSLVVIDEKWLDKDTYVVVFDDKIDSMGDVYHIVAEYHADEKKFVFAQVYEHEVLDANTLMVGIKKQIKEYILQQLGVLRNGSILQNQSLTINLELDIPQDVTIGELHEFIESLKVEIVHTKVSKDEKIRILSVKCDK